ncbi:hypothetical protein GCM10007096_37370 [Pullulanibacillus pueri]|uniref:Uncharacterized protein n=1 Tax=Pullulanibacillus pueri TaxID=1437324 RepID=A0A8J3A0F1_9BACL|nr:hypothetical protein GCM10007096_37370 [Pullulanibacillus pueri]
MLKFATKSPSYFMKLLKKSRVFLFRSVRIVNGDNFVNSGVKKCLIVKQYYSDSYLIHVTM